MQFCSCAASDPYDNFKLAIQNGNYNLVCSILDQYELFEDHFPSELYDFSVEHTSDQQYDIVNRLFHSARVFESSHSVACDFLLSSCKFGNMRILAFAMNKGADANYIGGLPIRTAAKYGQTRVIKQLLTRHNTILCKQAIFEARNHGYMELANLLFQEYIRGLGLGQLQLNI